MYAWIWRKLPFGLAGKLAGTVLIISVALALLWYIVFPWAEVLLPFGDVQVDSGVPDAPGGPAGPVGGDPGVDGGDPGMDDHDLPYDTGDNNTPPPSPSR